MARKRKELPLLEKVTITDVAAEGKAIAKVNDLVIFVPYVVPGDVVDLQIKRKKHHYAEAEAVKFHEYSAVRAVPFCQHYGVCGGCKWQVLPYSEQIKYKQKQVTDNLTRIGKIELPEISPILGSEKTQFYRNKLEFTFSNKRWLTNDEVRQDVKYDQMNAVGFHIPGAFDKVLAIEKCWLQDDISNRIRNAVRDYAYEHDYSFINLRTQEGMLRNMIIRTSSTGELMSSARLRKTMKWNYSSNCCSSLPIHSPKSLLSYTLLIISATIRSMIWMYMYSREKTICLKKWKDCVSKSVRNHSIRPIPNRHTIYIR